MERLSRSTAYAPISVQNGTRLIDFDVFEADGKTLKDQKPFQLMVEQAVNNITFDGDVTVDPKLFAANSGLLENDWENSKNGEDYLERSLGGRPDLQRPVRNIDTEIRSRIGAGFAEK